MKPEYQIFVPGIPRPQGSKSYLGGGRMVESSKYVKAWRQSITTIARHELKRMPPIDGPVSLDLEFIMPTRKHETAPGGWVISKPDLDKLIRAVCDALTKVAYVDDSHVVTIHAIKRRARLGETAGVKIKISRANPPEEVINRG